MADEVITEHPSETGDDSNETAPELYVGIGASAGGLEAIEQFFKNMPADTGLTFIVIQHLSPDYKSLMVELLSKRTKMKVHRAENGMRVQANNVYLIPPKKNLTIFHGKLLLNEQDISRGINLPIDVFFRSLAEDQGENAVGIILSGTGSDGMRGIRAIKEAGGMAMVQDEESAKFNGMPRSAISTGLTDFILPPDEMPKHLLSYLKHPYATKTEIADSLLSKQDSLTRIFAMLREKKKIDFTYYKPSTVVRRIERRMTINQMHDLNDYIRFIESYPRELSTLYKELLIGVTSFFRDPDVFSELQDKWLPELFERNANREIRFWVAGCSSGEEAYSLAIACRECMEKMQRTVDLKIFATDVDADAIMVAGNGVYPDSIAADLSPALLTKYFQKREESYQVVRSLREMVVFASHNLIKDPPFTNIDLITCRNLLIYLQPVLQRKAMTYFNFSLNKDGILVLGTSETTGDFSENYEVLHTKWKIYRSRGKQSHTGDALRVGVPLSTKGRFYRPRTAERQHQEDHLFERILDALSGRFVPLTVIVNEAMELVHIIGDSSEYFKLPAGKMTNDVTRMAVKDLSIPLATGIQKAFKSRETIRYTNIILRGEDNKKNLSMKITLLPEKKGQEPLAAVFIEESQPSIALAPDPDSSSYDIGKDAEQRIIDLEQELQFTRENLQATIEELETSNEELQATNEELLASNEELQSTNEELQSVNEELHTVNSEYQQKIIELTELNNDIDNLLTSSKIATVFIDENLELRRFTPEAAKIFHVIESDTGRPMNHIKHQIVDMDINSVIDNVQSSSESMEKEIHTESGDWYLMRALPYTIGPNTFSGVVLTFIDITSTIRAKQARDTAQEAFKVAVEAVNDGIWDWDVASGDVYYSPRWPEILGFQPDEIENSYQFWESRIHPDDRDRVAANLKKHLDGDAESFLEEHRLKKKDGGWLWIEGKGRVTKRDVSGRPLRVTGTMTDITRRKAAEQAANRLSFAVEHAGDAIFLTDLDTVRFVNVNKQACINLQYTEEELLEIGPHVIAEGYDEDSIRAVADSLEPGEYRTIHAEHIRKDGSKIPVEIRTGLLVQDDRKYILSLARDMTQFRRYRQCIQEKDRRFKMMFDTMLNGCALHKIITDEDGRPMDYIFLDVNESFEKLTGLKRDDILGKTVKEVLPDIEKDDFDWIGEYGRVALGGEPIRFERQSGPLGKTFRISAYSPEENLFVTIFDEV